MHVIFQFDALESLIKSQSEELLSSPRRILGNLDGAELNIAEVALHCEYYQYLLSTSSRELAIYYDNALADIIITFGCSKDPIIISEFSGPLSDYHDKFRHSFAFSINGRRHIYKPKKSTSHHLFNELRDLLASRESTLLGKVATIQGGDFSVEEWLPDSSVIEASDVFRSLGHLVSIFNLLRGTDLHYENIILSGQNLYVVDTETLLSPVVAGESRWTPLQTGIAMGGIDFQQVGWQHSPSVFAARSGSRASLIEKVKEFQPDFQTSEAISEFVTGFCDGSAFFLLNKKKICNLILNYSTDDFRYVMRNTVAYKQLIKLALSPHNNPTTSSVQELLKRLITPTDCGLSALECKSLLDANIPLITHTGAETFAKLGNSRIPGYFLESGFSAVNNYINGLTVPQIDSEAELLKSELVKLTAGNFSLGSQKLIEN